MAYVHTKHCQSTGGGVVHIYMYDDANPMVMRALMVLGLVVDAIGVTVVGDGHVVVTACILVHILVL